MDISTPVTLEVADNVNVSEMDGAVVINKDFNSILQRDYHRRSILTITVEDGIVKKKSSISEYHRILLMQLVC